MADEIKPTGDDKESVVSKEDLDKATARAEKAEKDLEDVRMEVLTPEYQKFLDSLEKGGDDKDKGKDEPKDKAADEDFEKLSKKELFERAVKQAEANIRGELSKKELDAKAQSDSRTKREIAAFAKTHDDYAKYRPVMYGLSLEIENADLTLEQLYTKAKAHVKALHGGPTEEEKAKSRKAVNEKPGGDSKSLERLSKMSNDEIAQEAWTEMQEKGATLELQ